MQIDAAELQTQLRKPMRPRPPEATRTISAPEGPTHADKRDANRLVDES